LLEEDKNIPEPVLKEAELLLIVLLI